jgi:hypothetical protein
MRHRTTMSEPFVMTITLQTRVGISWSYDCELQRQRCKNLQRTRINIIFHHFKNALAYFVEHWRCSCKLLKHRTGSRFYQVDDVSIRNDDGPLVRTPRLGKLEVQISRIKKPSMIMKWLCWPSALFIFFTESHPTLKIRAIHHIGIYASSLIKPKLFCVANTLKIQPFHKGQNQLILIFVILLNQKSQFHLYIHPA